MDTNYSGHETNQNIVIFQDFIPSKACLPIGLIEFEEVYATHTGARVCFYDSIKCVPLAKPRLGSRNRAELSFIPTDEIKSVRDQAGVFFGNTRTSSIIHVPCCHIPTHQLQPYVPAIHPFLLCG